MRDRENASGDNRSFVRYLCVGATCFCLNWGLMLLIDRDRYVLSSAICFVLVGTFAYVCHACWTFRAPIEMRGLAAYLLGSAPGYPLSLALLALSHDLMRIDLRWAFPAATLVMLILNFVVARIAILHNPLRSRSRLQAAQDV